MKIIWKIFALVSLFIFLSAFLLSCDPGSTEYLEEGKKNDLQMAPPFEGEELFSGEVMEFPADWEGKVIYLNFFSTG